MSSNLLHFLVVTVAGWLQGEQLTAIIYLQAENGDLREHLHGKRIRFTDSQRRKLARVARPLSARTQREIATLVTPELDVSWPLI